MNIKQYIEDSKAKTAEGIWKADFRYPIDNPVIKSLDFFEDEINRPGQIKGWWTDGETLTVLANSLFTEAGIITYRTPDI